jgi:hypothetical protein
VEYVEDQAIVRIAQLDPLNVEAIVPIELFGKIYLGMAAEVHPEILVAETRPARVTVVDRAGDAGSGTFGVRLEMPNPEYELPAGLKCDLRFLPDSVVAVTKPSQLRSQRLPHQTTYPRDLESQAETLPDESTSHSSKGNARARTVQKRDEQASELRRLADLDKSVLAGKKTDLAEKQLASGLADDMDPGVVESPGTVDEYHPIRLNPTGAEPVDAGASAISRPDNSPAMTAEEGGYAGLDQSYRIGPIRSQSELGRIVDLLLAQDVQYQVRREVVEERLVLSM